MVKGGQGRTDPLVWDRMLRDDVERSVLRLRLAAAALASTFLVLSPRADLLPALLTVAYAVAAAALFVLAYRTRGTLLTTVGAAIDVSFATALVLYAPANVPTWTVYSFAIGSSALRRGVGGAIATTAASLVAYDAALALRASDLDASLVWAVQVLVASGLVVAELSWARARGESERVLMRRHALALRALARSTEVEPLLDALVTQALDLCDLEAAWIWRTDAEGTTRIAPSRGAIPPAAPPGREGVLRIPLAEQPSLVVGAQLRGEDPRAREAALRDLVDDARPLVAAALERERGRDAVEVLRQQGEHGAAIASARDEAEALAQVMLASASIVGQSAVVRAGEGALVVGDLPREPLVELARGIAPPAIVRRSDEWLVPALSGLGARSAAVVSLGEGRTLVAVSADRVVDATRLEALEHVARAFRGVVERLAEREHLARDLSDLRRAVEATAVPIVAWDDQGEVALMSRAYAELFARRPLRAPRDLTPGAVSIAEVSVPHEGGERAYRVIATGTGVPELAHLAVLCDVTPERAILRARDEAVQTAAHELRTPLTAVHGWAQVMQRNLGSIQGQITQLGRLVNDLLASASGKVPYEDLALAEADLRDVVRDAASRARQATGATVRVSLPDARVPARVDALRLAQVLDNVLQNAAKYSTTDAPIELALALESGEATVRVRDRGIGIAHDELPFVFDRFYRSPRTKDTAGTGLGLAISRDIVIAHGGRIWAESAGPGEGSTFVVALPVGSPVADPAR